MKSTLLAALALTFAAGCAKPDAVPGTPPLPVAKVHVAPVQAAEIPRLTEVTGTIRPVRRAVLAAKVMGAITELPITLGQAVQANDVLVKIHSADASARLSRAQSELNVTRRDLERERDLLAKGASTAETVRNLQDRLNGSEATVKEAEAQLAYAEIRAPFDGVIARKLVDAGDLANPGQPLLELEGTGEFEVEATIPDSFAATLKAGSLFAIETGGTTFNGTLREFSSRADPATRSIQVKIAVPAGNSVRSGQFTRVLVPGPAIRALLVPAEAVSLNGQMERVFVVGDGNRAVLRLVRSGATRTNAGRPFVEILSGLAGNERVVLAPPAGLREGQTLEVLP